MYLVEYLYYSVLIYLNGDRGSAETLRLLEPDHNGDCDHQGHNEQNQEQRAEESLNQVNDQQDKRCRNAQCHDAQEYCDKDVEPAAARIGRAAHIL